MGRREKIDKETLLNHARAVFSDRGAAGSTKEIAKRAGISEAAIFKRFPTKAELFLAAMMPTDADPMDIVDTETHDARDALCRSAHNLLAYFRKIVPTAIQLATHPDSSVQEVAAQFRPKDIPAIAQQFETLLNTQKAKGQINAQVTPASAHLLIAAVHSLAVYEMLGLHGNQSFEQNIEPFIDAMWHGLDPHDVSNTKTPEDL